MANDDLKHIMMSARQESYRMRHYYLGAEHLFIALLEKKGGITARIVQEHGLTPEYVIEAIRRKTGKGSKHRLWAGVPNTPRADILINIARDIALESGREDPDERDLLTAILEEHDSIPVRVLSALGVNEIHDLVETVYQQNRNNETQPPYVEIHYGQHMDEDDLTREQMFIIRRMFYGYPQIRIERRLTGGYTSAILLVITPMHGDNREDASVVVKIDRTDTILDETQRYESYVKRTLPPLTARLEEKPVAPESMNLAGIKYTLIAGSDRIPHDLRATINEWQPQDLGSWLRNELFPAFGRIWWRQSRPYRFQVWQEYDWVLPPVLTLEFAGDKPLPPDGYTLKFPVKRAKLNAIEYGDTVSVENFTVQKVYPERGAIQLALGVGTDAAQSYKVEVRNLNFEENTYYRGEVVDRIVGTVWKTRAEQLLHAIRALEPDFNAEAEKIPMDESGDLKLPNPLKAYEDLMDIYINGSLSTIHGDLHLGNIMIGPNNSAFLIDFAHSRDGHTVFDWATLEISLLADVVLPTLGETWADARTVVQYLSNLNHETPYPDANALVAHALAAVTEVRDIVDECLSHENNWKEYYVALAFCGLRATTWETMSIGSRRLMYLISALAIRELRSGNGGGGGSDSMQPDATDISTNL